MKFLVQFAQQLIDFKLQEFNSLLVLNGLDPAACYDRATALIPSPFLVVELPSEDVARRIAARQILGLRICSLLAHAPSYDELLPAELSWCLQVRSFGRKLSMSEQRQLREPLVAALEPLGAVELNEPQMSLWALEESHLLPHQTTQVQSTGWYLGRLVCDCHRTAIAKYDLSHRAFLGPTSMDPEVALLMANQALARPGALLLDPFVGTGSVLVGAAHFGAATVGSDIDFKILHGRIGSNFNKRTKDVPTLFTNFDQYHLPWPDIMRLDLSRRPLRTQRMWDAIVCDPPYGIRAGGRRSGVPPGVEVQPVPEAARAGHVPRTRGYEGEDIYADLVDFAAAALVPGGRLVFFMAAPHEWTPEALPAHSCMRVVDVSAQGLTLVYCRLLVTMEKVAPYEPDSAERNKDECRRRVRAVLNGLREKVFDIGEREELFLPPPTGDESKSHLRKRERREQKAQRKAERRRIREAGERAGGEPAAGAGAPEDDDVR